MRTADPADTVRCDGGGRAGTFMTCEGKLRVSGREPRLTDDID